MKIFNRAQKCPFWGRPHMRTVVIELVVLGSYEDSGVKKLGKRKEKFLMCHPYLWLILFAKKYYRAPQKNYTSAY